MKQWAVQKQIMFGFAVMLAVLLGASAFNYFQLLKVETHERKIVLDCLPGMYLAGRIELDGKDAFRLAEELAGSETTAALAHHEEALKDGDEQAAKHFTAYEATITMPKDRELFKDLTEGWQAFVGIRDSKVIPASRALKRVEALAALEKDLLPAATNYLTKAAAVTAFNRTNGEESGRAIEQALASAKRSGLIAVLSGVLAAVMVSALIIRSIGRVLRRVTTRLDEGSTQVAAAAGQVSSSSQSLAEGASEQTARCGLKAEEQKAGLRTLRPRSVATQPEPAATAGVSAGKHGNLPMDGDFKDF